MAKSNFLSMCFHTLYTLCILFFSTSFLFSQNSFDRADEAFDLITTDGLVDYNRALESEAVISKAIDELTHIYRISHDQQTQKAALINLYNLLVIEKILDYPAATSVQDIPRFFTGKFWTLDGEKISLDDLEKNILYPNFEDPRLHFALVCGAMDCPPLLDEAFKPGNLDDQLDKITSRALSSEKIVEVDEEDKKIFLSQIFNWYRGDFGGSNKDILNFINRYRKDPVPSGYGISFHPYDWTLNAPEGRRGNTVLPDTSSLAPNASRYVVSSTIPKGGIELKIFNNLYTENAEEGNGLRSNFFTTTGTFLYGLSSSINLGIEVRYRQVSNDPLPASPLKVFSYENDNFHGRGLTTIGPKIRFAPLPSWSNFSIQSTYWIPLKDGLESNPFVDWNGPTFWTQALNDFTVGEHFSLFTELGLMIEDMGAEEEGAINRISTPATVIFSYYPSPALSLYSLGNYSPYWSETDSYFWQLGAGIKYQIIPQFEIELLVTTFHSNFLQSINGAAATYNLGFRYSR